MEYQEMKKESIVNGTALTQTEWGLVEKNSVDVKDKAVKNLPVKVVYAYATTVAGFQNRPTNGTCFLFVDKKANMYCTKTARNELFKIGDKVCIDYRRVGDAKFNLEIDGNTYLFEGTEVNYVKVKSPETTV